MSKARKQAQEPAGGILKPETSVPSPKAVEKLRTDLRTFCMGWERFGYVSWFQEREFGGNLS